MGRNGRRNEKRNRPSSLGLGSGADAPMMFTVVGAHHKRATQWYNFALSFMLFLLGYVLFFGVVHAGAEAVSWSTESDAGRTDPFMRFIHDMAGDMSVGQRPPLHEGAVGGSESKNPESDEKVREDESDVMRRVRSLEDDVDEHKRRMTDALNRLDQMEQTMKKGSEEANERLDSIKGDLPKDSPLNNSVEKASEMVP